MQVPNRWFLLYRPTVPSARAQSIQVVHMAHALANQGIEVTLTAEAPNGANVRSVLAFYGLAPHPRLRLYLLPGPRTRASWAFRAHFVRWAARGGLVYARSKRYAVHALRFSRAMPVVLEAHELDSALAVERGEDPKQWIALEKEVLAKVVAVVANAPGTLAVLKKNYQLPPSIALQNATHSSRARIPLGTAHGVGYIGSLRSYKDLDTLRALAAVCSLPITVVGGDTSIPGITVEPPIPHREVPDRLIDFRVLLLPLSHGLYGDYLASPLKLWDYMAVKVPVVGANTPALHAAAPKAFLPYEPGNAQDLGEKLRRLYFDSALRADVLSHAYLRTWDQRAKELLAFLRDV